MQTLKRKLNCSTHSVRGTQSVIPSCVPQDRGNRGLLKRLLYSILLVQCLWLSACGGIKNDLSSGNLLSKKLISVQALNTMHDNHTTCVNDRSVDDQKNIELKKSIRTPKPILRKSLVTKEPFKFNSDILSSLSDKLEHKLNHLAIQPSYINEEINPEKKENNPYIGPLFYCLGILMFLALMLFTAVGYMGLSFFAGFFLMGALTIPALLIFLVSAVFWKNKGDNLNDRVISYGIFSTYLLVAFLCSLVFLSDGISILSGIFILGLLVLFIVYISKLITSLKQTEKEQHKKTKEKPFVFITDVSFVLGLISLITTIVAYTMNFYMWPVFALIFLAIFLIWLFEMLRNISKAIEETKSKVFSFFCAFSFVAALLILPLPFAILALIPLSIGLVFLYLCIRIIRAGNRPVKPL